MRCAAVPLQPGRHGDRNGAVCVMGETFPLSSGRGFDTHSVFCCLLSAGLRLNHFTSGDSEPGVRKATEKYAS